MNPKWLIGLGTLFVVGTLLSGLLEQQYFGSNEAGVFYRLLTSYKEIEFTNPLIALGTFVSVAWTYIKDIWAMFWWNYAFFEGSWEIVKYAIFWPISIGLVVSLVLAAVRGVSTGG